MINTSLFYQCSNLNHIIFPPNLEIIQSKAFFACTSLVSLDFPETLKFINESAFMSCMTLIHFNIVNSLSLVGNKSFYFTALPCGFITSPDKVFLFRFAVPIHCLSECQEITWKYKDQFIKLFIQFWIFCL